MSDKEGAGTSKKQKLIQVKYKKINLADVHFDEGSTFFQSGQFGDVKKAKWNGKVVAVKCFNSADRKGGFQEELVCLSLLQTHPNIVVMYGAVYSDRPLIVLEFAPLSLEKVIHECKKVYKYTADHVLSWSYQIALGLEYIHSKEMLHRDVKPSNVLLFHHGKTLKLCDFGTAKKLEHTLTNAVGTIRYMAPEVIRGKYYSDKCDIFSFGIVLWEMLTRRRPTLTKGSQNQMAIMYAMANGATPPQIQNLPKAISDLIHKCFDEEPQKRQPITEIRKKLEFFCKYVETGKSLIPRGQPRKNVPQSNRIDVIAPQKSDMQQQEVKVDKTLKSEEKEPESEEDKVRDRSYTEPQRPVQITKGPISSADTVHYSKQVSSPASSVPSIYKEGHSRSVVFPSPGHATMGSHGQKSVRTAAGFGHQESEYGEMEVHGVTDLLSDHDLLQDQSERYQQIEKAMSKRTGEFPMAEVGSPLFITGLNPDLQPLIPDENNPDSMAIYRQYCSMAEQVVTARREQDELREENSKLDKEIKSDEQRVTLQGELHKEYRQVCTERDELMRQNDSLNEEHSSLLRKSASMSET